MEASDLVITPSRPPEAPSGVRPSCHHPECGQGFWKRAFVPPFVLVSVSIPENEDMLESIRFSFSDSLACIVGFVPRPSSPDWAAPFEGNRGNQLIQNHPCKGAVAIEAGLYTAPRSLTENGVNQFKSVKVLQHTDTL